MIPGGQGRFVHGEVDSLDEFVEALDRLRGLGDGDDPQSGRRSLRLSADDENIEQGLAKLVLTLVELLRQLLEKQALRRMESGTLTDEEIERLGVTFMKLQERIEVLKQVFGLEGEDLNVDLGPLSDVLESPRSRRPVP